MILLQQVIDIPGAQLDILLGTLQTVRRKTAFLGDPLCGIRHELHHADRAHMGDRLFIEFTLRQDDGF